MLSISHFQTCIFGLCVKAKAGFVVGSDLCALQSWCQQRGMAGKTPIPEEALRTASYFSHVLKGYKPVAVITRTSLCKLEREGHGLSCTKNSLLVIVFLYLTWEQSVLTVVKGTKMDFLFEKQWLWNMIVMKNNHLLSPSLCCVIYNTTYLFCLFETFFHSGYGRWPSVLSEAVDCTVRVYIWSWLFTS